MQNSCINSTTTTELLSTSYICYVLCGRPGYLSEQRRRSPCNTGLWLLNCPRLDQESGEGSGLQFHTCGSASGQEGQRRLRWVCCRWGVDPGAAGLGRAHGKHWAWVSEATFIIQHFLRCLLCAAVLLCGSSLLLHGSHALFLQGSY